MRKHRTYLFLGVIGGGVAMATLSSCGAGGNGSGEPATGGTGGIPVFTGGTGASLFTGGTGSTLATGATGGNWVPLTGGTGGATATGGTGAGNAAGQGGVADGGTAGHGGDSGGAAGQGGQVTAGGAAGAGGEPIGGAGGSAGATGGAGAGGGGPLPVISPEWHFTSAAEADDWIAAAAGVAGASAAHDPAVGYAANLGSLAATIPFSGTTGGQQQEIYVDYASGPVDLSGQTITVQVRLTSGGVASGGSGQIRALIYAQSSSANWYYASSTAQVVVIDDWMALTLDLDSAPSAQLGFDPAEIVRIGVRFDSAAGAGFNYETAVIHIDDFVVN